jgi:hypothetical protein
MGTYCKSARWCAQKTGREEYRGQFQSRFPEILEPIPVNTKANELQNPRKKRQELRG